jgi:hypothetical protein
MTAQAVQSPTTMAKALGVASVGIGLTELVAPRRVARMSGVEDTDRARRTIRMLGARELGHAAAILLGSPRQVWTRVAGDALDITLLGKGLQSPRASRARGAVAAIGLTGITAADIYAALRNSSDGRRTAL